MSGVLTYNTAYQVQSAQVGYAIMQAGKQGYLTDTAVQNATSAQDLIDYVNGAVVTPGAESPAQRNSITRAIAEGKSLGDLSDVRIAAATGITDLAEKTWITNDPNYLTHLGVNLIP